jgi:hypothetical protein
MAKMRIKNLAKKRPTVGEMRVKNWTMRSARKGPRQGLP